MLVGSLLAAVTVAPLSAQGLDLGVEAGINVSDISGSDGRDTRDFNGFRGGLTFGYGFGEEGALGVRSGLIYSEKGAEAPGTGTRTIISYLEVPVTLVWNIPLAGIVRPRILGGGLLGLGPSCSQESLVGGPPTDCAEQGLEAEGTDVGLLLGGGFGVAVSENATLTVDGRYNLGLADIEEGSSLELENRVLQVNVGAEFRL